MHVQDITKADIFYKCEEKILNKSMIQEGRAFLKVHDAEKEVSKNTPNSPLGSYWGSAHFKRSSTKKLNEPEITRNESKKCVVKANDWAQGALVKREGN